MEIWLNESMNDAWELGVKPAIFRAGYKPIRIDETHYTGRIDDKIIGDIRLSKFVVTDFTQGDDRRPR